MNFDLNPNVFFVRSDVIQLLCTDIANDCGPTCLYIISMYYGIDCDINNLRIICNVCKYGVSLHSLKIAAIKLGYETLILSVSLDWLEDNALFPCIIFCDSNHYAILYKFSSGRYFIASPGIGLISLNHNEFIKKWINNDGNGIVFFLSR